MFQCKRLTPNATIPIRASKEAAGHDLFSAYEYTIKPHTHQLVKTDIAISIPQGTYGRIAPRSGLAYKNCIDVLAGVIDYDYRGNVGVILINHSDEDFIIEKGHRIAQIVLEKIDTSDIIEVEELDDTQRGKDGFGSTGNK